MLVTLKFDKDAMKTGFNNPTKNNQARNNLMKGILSAALSLTESPLSFR